MIVDQASVNQTIFLVSLTYTAYQFDTSYACQVVEVRGNNRAFHVIVKYIEALAVRVSAQVPLSIKLCL